MFRKSFRKVIDGFLVVVLLTVTWFGLWTIMGDSFRDFSIDFANLMKIPLYFVIYVFLAFYPVQRIRKLLDELQKKYNFQLGVFVTVVLTLALSTIIGVVFYLLLGPTVKDFFLMLGYNAERLNYNDPTKPVALLLVYANFLIAWM